MTSEMEEEVTLDHFIHEHPLSLIQSDKGGQCRGCFRRFTKEAAYGCKKCGDEKMLHQECEEMPRKIMHPKHPQHTLVQQRGDGSMHCALCGKGISSESIGYYCSSSICKFMIHLVCAPAKGMEHVDDQRISIVHPSHEHELVLVKKKHSFKCDACGTMETGRSYMCFSCQYWIHERCAALPSTATYHHHHHHPLSLAFYLPIKYIKYLDACDLCRKNLVLNRWVYHCELCRFVVHIKCAVGPSLLPTVDEDANEADSQGLIRFPISEAHEEIIKAFVMREKGEMGMPRDDKKQYRFSTHRHGLSLVSSSISEINNDDDDDDDLNYGQIKEELVCDACTMPIFQKHKNNASSSSSSSSSSSDYMSCGECKYFLHLACFHLPPELPSHPLHEADHKLILKTVYEDNHLWDRCSMCWYGSNGVFYSCTKCNFKADIKCACLPNTIQHEAHPHHHLHSNFIPLFDVKNAKGVGLGDCVGCRAIIYGGIIYKCGICDVMLCRHCIFHPPTNKHESDKHPLPLRYDANLDHPDDFCCDQCEQQMNPKEWMYHCRSCDTSFHPKCFPATSGAYRNAKFGQQYRVAAALHPHPLTYQLLTTKLRCDLCRHRIYGEEVDQDGFYCWSCNFFACRHCLRL